MLSTLSNKTRQHPLGWKRIPAVVWRWLLGTHQVHIYNTQSCHRPAKHKSRCNESPESTIVRPLVARCVGYYWTVHRAWCKPCKLTLPVVPSPKCRTLGPSPIAWWNLCTPYPAELRLSMGLENSLYCRPNASQSTRTGIRKIHFLNSNFLLITNVI